MAVIRLLSKSIIVTPESHHGRTTVATNYMREQPAAQTVQS